MVTVRAKVLPTARIGVERLQRLLHGSAKPLDGRRAGCLEASGSRDPEGDPQENSCHVLNTVA